MAAKCDNVCLGHSGRENSEKLNTMQWGLGFMLGPLFLLANVDKR